jgi:hypothetical protein
MLFAAMTETAHVPVMITETAADPEAGQARWMREIAAGITAYGLAGFAWFDINQENGADPSAPHGNRHDWSIDSSNSVLSLFRKAVSLER